MKAILDIIMAVLVILTSTSGLAVLPEEHAIAGGSVECAVGFDASGIKVFELCGDSRGVTPSPDQILSIRGGTFTHSHVGECPTLSFGDMDSGARSGLREMRAVSHLNGRVVVASVVPPMLISVRDFEEALASTTGSICARMDQVWKLLAPKYGFRYSTS